MFGLLRLTVLKMLTFRRMLTVSIHWFQIQPGHATRLTQKEMFHVNDLRLRTAERLTEQVEGLINTYCHDNGCKFLESIKCY